MRYKYVFNSPVKFLIRVEKTDIDDIEVSIEEIQPKLQIDLNKKSEELLHSISKDFASYINREGILDIIFKLKNGNILETTVIMDHSLKRKDFIALFTDIEGQLFAGIGQKFIKMPLYKYEDNIEYVNNKGMKECKPATKIIFCSLWQDNHWKLKFIAPSE